MVNFGSRRRLVYVAAITVLVVWALAWAFGLRFVGLTIVRMTFTGYESKVARIAERVDLTEIMDRARWAGYRVDYRIYLVPEGDGIQRRVRMSGQANGSTFILRYDRTGNLTHFFYDFPFGTISPKKWLSNKLSQYMHLESGEVNKTIQSRFSGLELMGSITGEPDWKEVRRDLGNLITNHSRTVGEVYEKYASGEIAYAIPQIVIYAEKLASLSPTSIVTVDLKVDLDERGNSLLWIRCKERLLHPSIPFIWVFASLSLPTSLLPVFEFHEIFVGLD